MVITGPNSPKDFNSFLQLLVDELSSLNLLFQTQNLTKTTPIALLTKNDPFAILHIYYPLQSLQEYNNYEPENLPMHYHNNYILDSKKCKNILFELSSINFPLSFPVDIMHALFENIAPHMFHHFIGKFFKNKNSNNTKFQKIIGMKLKK
ncbi:hypothetical protein C2G38_2177732 [Gigaspora rosea]|uniref:Uncharacterized protein n=1 Tax=Gigaspora rosea TaxID=44941 RepID=A0A397VP96_9GLOM|nr:hypothetical protein C2G38_2177732 [Gigaspora rosea]